MTIGIVRVLNARNWLTAITDNETPVYVGRGRKIANTEHAELGNPFPVLGMSYFGPMADAAVEYILPRLWRECPDLLVAAVEAKRNGGFKHEEAAQVYRYYLREAIKQRKSDVRPTIMHYASRVAKGESIALICWCSPKPCHAEHIKAAIEVYAKRKHTSIEALSAKKGSHHEP